ncbi:MAG: hypothetical protein DHS20C05_24130 [Hyphococcus sp.]|nr:MAG: hypothetical protein DHS20C05_24130 [Marinicaulis sp.]
MTRFLTTLILSLWIATTVTAEERITNFAVNIQVEKDGDILVTEVISVNAEGRQIRRGIFRDLPRYYTKGGKKLPYSYDIRRVEKNGKREPYAKETVGNAFRIRIGDADVFLSNGAYHYKITYEVKNQARYFDSYDEIYWNATGSYWAFPIDKAEVRISLPGEAGALQQAAYTGGQGSNAQNYDYAFRGGVHYFNSVEKFDPREGMTVSVGFAKGVIDPPSASDARAEWWMLNASLVVLVLAFLGLAFYYLVIWRRVGVDPPKGPVFARYEPPDGYSPAAAHHVFHRGFSGHDAFTSTLMDLATKGLIKIELDDRKETKITNLRASGSAVSETEEIKMVESLCSPGEAFTFGDDYSASLTGVYERYKKTIANAYGKTHFQWNRGFLIVAVIVTVLAIILAVNLAIDWTSFHTATAIGLGVMALAASYFLPAPTEVGQKIRTEIEGFRLYLKTAEELQLNAVDVGSGAPPPMSVERYERFLPYAIALGVEKPWAKHFENLMPKEAAAYTPRWSHAYGGHDRSLSSLNSALVSGISSGVSSSLPQSSSSSGSSGGGSSGGGGGGGGGGGW